MNKPFYAVYANTIDPFIPEHWANESIAILIENMVAANLVHRDFEMQFARFGDIVNTRKPAEFTAKRKTDADTVTVQDASATNVAVPLDQHVHVSFLIKDGEETKSFKNLVDEYLNPAAIAMARIVDQIVLGQVYQFIENSGGTLNALAANNGPTFITQTRKVMNNNKVPMDGRNLILTSDSESFLLQNSIFIQANTVGDQGGAMAEANLGRKFGFDIWLAQNMSSVIDDSSGTDVVGLINNAGGYPAGTTVLTVDGYAEDKYDFAGTSKALWISINGVPYHVLSSTLTGGFTVTITLEYGLRDSVADNDIITAYSEGQVNGAFAAKFAKDILFDTLTGDNLQEGQLISFGTDTDRYTVIQTDGTTTMLLDRPLEKALTDNQVLNLGPSGDFNFAFHRNCLSLVIRPLALPRAGTGALSGLASFGGVAMRTTITYDGDKQGHLVTLDFLAGIKVLDTPLGAVMLG